MLRALALFGPVLTVLLAATAAFGADRPTLAMGAATVFLALGGISAISGFSPKLAAPAVLATGGGVLVLLSQLLGPSFHHAIPDMLTLAAAGAIYLTVAVAASRTTGAVLVSVGLSLGLILISVGAFAGFVTSPESLYGQPKAFHETRLTAAFLSANTAATLFGMATLFGLTGVLRALGSDGAQGVMLDRIGRMGGLPLVLLIFAGTCLVLTGSRGGIMATGLASMGLLLWGQERLSGKNTLIALLFMAFGLLLLLLISGSVLGDRLSATGALEASGREDLWRASLGAFFEMPLQGHGMGRFEAALAGQMTPETAPELVQQGAAHNLLLQWLLQTGLIGTAGGLMLLLAAVWPLLKGLGRRRSQRIMLKGSAMIALMVMIHGMLDYGLEIPAVLWWFSAFLGLGAGIATGERGPESRSRSSGA